MRSPFINWSINILFGTGLVYFFIYIRNRLNEWFLNSKGANTLDSITVQESFAYLQLNLIYIVFWLIGLSLFLLISAGKGNALNSIMSIFKLGFILLARISGRTT